MNNLFVSRIIISSSFYDDVQHFPGMTWFLFIVSLCTQLNGCIPLRWRHNDHDSVSNHQPHGCLLNRLFRHRWKKTSKLRVTGLCVGNSPGPVNSPHKGPVTRKMFPFDDVIMLINQWLRMTYMNYCYYNNIRWVFNCVFHRNEIFLVIIVIMLSFVCIAKWI